MIFPISRYCTKTNDIYSSICSSSTATISIGYVSCFCKWVFIHPNIAICLAIMNIKYYCVPVIIPGFSMNFIPTAPIVNINPISATESISNHSRKFVCSSLWFKKNTIRRASVSIPSIAYEFDFYIIITCSYCSQILSSSRVSIICH